MSSAIHCLPVWAVVFNVDAVVPNVREKVF